MLIARTFLLPILSVNILTHFACSESGENKAAGAQFDFNLSSTGLPILSTDEEKLDLILSSVFNLKSHLQDADKDEINTKLADMRESVGGNDEEFAKQILKTFSPQDIEIIHETLEEEGPHSGGSNVSQLSVNTDLLFAEIGADLAKKPGSAEDILESGAWTVKFPQGGFIDILVENGNVINSKAPCISGSCGTSMKSVKMDSTPVGHSTRSLPTPSNQTEKEAVRSIISKLNDEGKSGQLGFWELCMVENLRESYPTSCKDYHDLVLLKIGSIIDNLDRYQKVASDLVDICYVDLPDSTILREYEYCKEAADAGLDDIKVEIDKLSSK